MPIKPGVTEKILTFLAEAGKVFDLPKSFGDLMNPTKREYYRGLERERLQRRRERRRVKKALWRLEKAAAITFDKKLDKYKLTPAGWLKFMHYYNKRSSKSPSTEGIEKYFIIFDVPKKYDRFRDLFRQCLQNMGCRFEQKSVYQTADPRIFRTAQKIVANCELGSYVKFIEAKRIY